MIDVLTTEVVFMAGILGASVLAGMAGVALMRAPAKAQRKVDLNKAVRNAPYHRLHNVIPPHQR